MEECKDGSISKNQYYTIHLKKDKKYKIISNDEQKALTKYQIYGGGLSINWL